MAGAALWVRMGAWGRRGISLGVVGGQVGMGGKGQAQGEGDGEGIGDLVGVREGIGVLVGVGVGVREGKQGYCWQGWQFRGLGLDTVTGDLTDWS